MSVEDVDGFGLNSAAPASRCILTAPRLNESGAQGIGKSRGAWNTKIRMVAASDRMAMIVRLSGGHARDAPEGRALFESREKPGHPIFRLGGYGTAIPPIDDIGPSAFFVAAFGGEQGVGFGFRPTASRWTRKYGRHH